MVHGSGECGGADSGAGGEVKEEYGLGGGIVFCGSGI